MKIRNTLSSMRPHEMTKIVGLCAIALSLSACGGGSSEETAQDKSTGAVPIVIPPTQSPNLFLLPQTSGEAKQNSIAIQSLGTAGATAKRFQLQLPSSAAASSLKVQLDGADVTSQFTSAACQGSGTCMQGTLSTNAGTAKHVLTATVSYDSGHKASGRLRFAGANATTALGALEASVSCGIGVPCPEPFMAPTLAFNTLQPGGWDAHKGAWFQIAGVGYPTNKEPAECDVYGANYAAVVLNRQTLQEQPGSPRCFTNASDFNQFMGTLTSNDLVIGGTTPGDPGDAASINTTAVGGTPMSWTTPVGYMIIGAGQQAGGAYQPFSTSSASTDLISATGTLQEDANGDYNFQPSEVVQFASAPRDPAQLSTEQNSVFSITVPSSLASQYPTGVKRLVFTSPAAGAGLWLLQLDRITLKPLSNCSAGVVPSGADFMQYDNCGAIYDGAAGTAGDFGGLATTLDSGNAFKITVLQTFGTLDPNTMKTAGWRTFSAAAIRIGMTPQLLRQPQTNAAVDYSFVGYSGATNALTGMVAESSSALNVQGQTGFMRGVLQRNSYGLFQVSQVSQEPQVVFNAKGGLSSPDFALTTASYQQPVAWPSSDTTKLLPGATDIDQQISAYRFISHWLLAGYYVAGISGEHQDDIHYFFSGSTNTSINYHFMNPANLPFPSAGTWDDFGCELVNGDCYFAAPGDDAFPTLQEAHFDVATFNAVKKQMSLEVIYLTNALQFLSTGSTNLKDIIASGQTNAGLALTSAASTILSSKLLNDQVPVTQTVQFSWQSLLNTLGAVASTIADVEGLGELTTVWEGLSKTTQTKIKGTVGLANTVGAALGIATNASTIATKVSGPASLPSAFANFQSTIGELSSNQMQDTLIVGFDVLSDNITSDWGRLSTIGPMVVDTDNPVFFAPNQVQQINTLQALTTGAAQGFYFALMPVFYQVHYWPSVEYMHSVDSGIFAPYMGYATGGNGSTCYAFYVNPSKKPGLGTLPTTSGLWTIEQNYNTGYWGQESGGFDVFVIDMPNNGTSVPSISAALGGVLFAPNQLNIPMMQFVSQNGPMASVWANAVDHNPAGKSASDVCDAYSYGSN